MFALRPTLVRVQRFAGLALLLAGLVPVCRGAVHPAGFAFPMGALEFEPNYGQAAPEVRFVGRAMHYLAQLYRDGSVTYDIAFAGNRERVTTKLLGASLRAGVTGLEELAAKTHYYAGNDPAAWRTGIPHFARVRYEAIYPGIDLVFRGLGGEIEYEFQVAPGAAPSSIRLRFNAGLSLDASGDLVLHTGAGNLRHRRPVAYQVVSGRRREIKARFLLDGSAAGFGLGPYDARYPVMIDPVVSFSTHLGGNEWDAAYGIAAGASGDIYVTGETFSSTFPGRTTPNDGHRHVFVTRIHGAGVVYTTILASMGDDAGRSIVVEPAGNVYITGTAGGSAFPATASAVQKTFAGVQDAFVTKLDPAGHLVYSTYIGGSGADAGMGIAVNAAGNAYVAGFTESTSFPTTSGAPQRAFAGGFHDAFVLKLSAGGDALLYSTLLGGSGNDLASAVALDAAGNAILAGFTDSPNLPVRNAQQATHGGGGDAMVASLNPAGSAWNFVTYLGGRARDEASAVAIDRVNSIYVAGTTSSADFPATPRAYHAAVPGTYDAFVAKTSAAGALQYAAVFGGRDADSATSVAVSALGEAWVGGFTVSADFPVVDPLPATNRGSFDGFVSLLSPDGSSLRFSTLLGGARDDRVWGLTLDSSGTLWVTGYTLSADFPTTAGALQAVAPAGYNAFVTGIRPPPQPPAPVSVTPSSGTGMQQVFALKVADTSGAAGVTGVALLIHPSFGADHGCYVLYDAGSSRVYLATDQGTWSGFAALGGGGALENSQCRVDPAGAAVALQGTELTLTVPITFKSAFAGTKTTYAYTSNQYGASGWQAMGSWTVPETPARPPEPVSVVPFSGSGIQQVFAVKVADTSGAAGVTGVALLIHPSFGADHGCYVLYDAGSSRVYLATDQGTWSGFAALGGGGALENSQCRVDPAGAAVALQGTELTLAVPITFKSAFAGTKTTYVYTSNQYGASGWQAMGSWTVPETSLPEPVSVAPSSGSGIQQVFAVNIADAGGAANVAGVALLIHPSFGADHGCYLVYDAASSRIYLATDQGGWSGFAPLGGGSALENSQCRIDPAGTSVALQGPALTLTVPITFKSAFAGAKIIYAYASNRYGASGWRKMGAWTVP